MLYSEVGKERPGSDEVDLIELFAQVKEALAESFVENKITCTLSVPTPIHLRSDGQHLYTIFSNLILNAGEALRLRTDRPSSPKTISVTAENRRDQCIIAITDNGIGIAKEDLGRIFDPFFSTSPSSGMGIGLSLVNKHLTMYGASIQFESVQAQGTTVTVLFPLHSAQRED